MKIVKTIVTACLLTASACVFADNTQQGQKVYASCPPASAFHHAALGQPWTLDEPYKSQGWSIVKTASANWSNLNSISAKTPLSVRVHEEGAYMPVGQDKLKDVDAIFSITCAYVYKYVDNSQNQQSTELTETLFVKSSDTSAFFLGREHFVYQNDFRPYNPETQGQQEEKPEANWGWVCNTTATNPGACKLEINDPSVPPSDQTIAMADLKPAKK